MGNRWIINIMDKVGFSCYDVMDIMEIVDVGDTFNLVTGRGDMWLEKDYCFVREDDGKIMSIEYSTEYINVYVERISEEEISSKAA